MSVFPNTNYTSHLDVDAKQNQTFLPFTANLTLTLPIQFMLLALLELLRLKTIM